GHIRCYSHPGDGASFTIFLPLPTESPAQAAAEPETSPGEGEGPRGSEAILVVDDEESLRDLAARALGDKGYSVLVAASGEEALALYRERGPDLDLVIMDLGMPGMGGHKAMEAIQALNPQAKVVIASGYSAHHQVKSALAAGAAGYVAKPFRRADLLATVRQALDRS
ncbi:MAG: response regulator, partial [Syntrophobacterales bacterium]|nr:response regulator [Syntrophobacterales bacterium]